MGSIHLYITKNEEIQLKDFFNILKAKRIRPTSFSYCHSDLDLIGSINLRENLTLKQSPFRKNTVISPAHLSQSGKEHFQNFAKYIYDYSLLPEQADNQSQKVAALLKCITSNKKYFFLNQPEKYLSPLSLSAFKKLLIELKHHHEIFIASSDQSLWSNITTDYPAVASLQRVS